MFNKIWAFLWKIETLKLKKSKFVWKIENFVNNRNFYEKSKFLWNIEIFMKNRNFYEKSKFLWKFEIFMKNWKFYETLHIFENFNGYAEMHNLKKVNFKNWCVQCQKHSKTYSFLRFIYFPL